MGATQSTVQEKIPLEAFTVIQQETGFSEKEVSRLFERFQELDVEGKGFLSRRDLLAIPEISLNPVGDRIVHAFFKEGNSNKENDCLEFKNFARVMSHFHTFETDDPRGWERREKKLRFAFSIYDLNDDGVLSRSVSVLHTKPLNPVISLIKWYGQVHRQTPLLRQ